MMRCQSNSEFNTFAVWLFKSLRSTFWHKTTVESTNQSTAGQKAVRDKEDCKAAGAPKTQKM